jgi:hypothetical protein
MRLVLVCGLVLLGVGGPKKAKHPERKEPACAVQDCKTHKIIDDGCTDDGRCSSCVNVCEPPPTPKQ